ncbi:hypothetical protein [Flavobacterium sp. LC2016-13]|uniref:hypothetical protein n=1 Tax=Flavobacterium sp. LC2016-13 TaxID=2675875 RepID=UPI0012B8288A|nr:hypothetical protein [Flavobacterium sp. LC2016-13]MTD67655.1 hypothetical protein [Flavobacterium sp. LC2016-13]
METIEYFKLQAKNLHKDFKTQKPYFDSSLGDKLFEYSPKFFDVDALVTDFEIHENHFTLMNAQHIIAKLVGFEKWTEMLKASPPALELAKLRFDNMHKIRNEEWGYYIMDVENENNVTLDDEDKLDIFKTVFADVDGHQSDGYDYRLAKREKPSIENQKINHMEKKSTVKINTLPLAGKDHKEFIDTANRKFENTLQSIEHAHPELVRKLWNPEQYVEEVIRPDMLPIDRDYALSLVEAFLIHKVIEIANEVDEQGFKLN